MEAIELNVGGVVYTTTVETLTAARDSESTLRRIFSSSAQLPANVPRDKKGRIFIDRDGSLFRYVLDYLRTGNAVLPGSFGEKNRLIQEAQFYKLPHMVSAINAADEGKSLRQSYPHPNQFFKIDSPSAISVQTKSTEPAYITVGYRGTFSQGHDIQCDNSCRFRKIFGRILVCGRVTVCRDVFQDTLNESRDPDRGPAGRYSSRFYLKHSSLEIAFDRLQVAGFRITGSCSSGISSCKEIKPGIATSEERKWTHYNEYIFCRD